MRASIWITCVVLAVGCKKEHDDVKTKAVAIRNKAQACKNLPCAEAARDEYIALTKDLKGLSDEDSAYFGQLGVEIGELMVGLENAGKATAPTAPTPPPAAGSGTAPAATGTRTKAAGFSVVLPPGWETRDMGQPNVVLAAAKGESVSAMTTFVVARLPQAVEVGTKAACDTLGAEQSTELGGTLKRAAPFDLKAGTACLMVVDRDKHATLIAFIPAAKDATFYAMCNGVAGNATAQDECVSILGSWQPEP